MLTWTLFALAPRRPRHSSLSNMSYWLGFLVNELPFVAFYCLVASTLLAVGQRDLNTPVGWAGFVLAVLATIGLALIVLRGLKARPALERALDEGLGADWRRELDAGMAAGLRSRLPVTQIL